MANLADHIHLILHLASLTKIISWNTFHLKLSSTAPTNSYIWIWDHWMTHKVGIILIRCFIFVNHTIHHLFGWRWHLFFIRTFGSTSGYFLFLIPIINIFIVDSNDFFQCVCLYLISYILFDSWIIFLYGEDYIRVKIFQEGIKGKELTLHIDLGCYINSFKEVIAKLPNLVKVLYSFAFFIPKNSLKPINLCFQKSNVSICSNNETRFILYFP